MFRKTCEMVSPGHPDKFCDAIADAVVIDVMQNDFDAHVAIEVMATAGAIIVSGEVLSDYTPDYEALVWETIKKIGYTEADLGVESMDNLNISVYVHEQSPDIARKVNQKETGAGDQGIVYGYASNESVYLLDLPCAIANDIIGLMWTAYKDNTFEHLRPDMKCQVTVAYDDDHLPKEVETIVLSVQHTPGWDNMGEDLSNFIFGVFGQNATWNHYLTENTLLVTNAPGDFVLGGPAADTGVTGRKLACDTYGGTAHHGGGALSGKDPTKVDRTAAYYARWAAKSLVASGAMENCEISAAYVIGSPTPISVDVSGTINEGYQEVAEAIIKQFDFSVSHMMDSMFSPDGFIMPSVFSHFYLPPDIAPWENVDWVEATVRALKPELFEEEETANE